MKLNERGPQIPHYLLFIFSILLIKLVLSIWFQIKSDQLGLDHFK